MDTENLDIENTGKTENGTDNFDFTLADLYGICSGRDKSGTPAAAASLSLLMPDSDAEDGFTSKGEIAFNDTSLSLFLEGGCSVIQADFSGNSSFEYRRALQILEQWDTERKKNSEYNGILSLVTVPLLLDGKVYMAFSAPAYYTGVPLADRAGRLILCFDTAAMQIYESDDISYAEISEKIRAELDAQEKQLDNEIAQLESEVEEAKKQYNPYTDRISDEYYNLEFGRTDKDDISSNPNIRSAKRSQTIRSVHDDDENS